MTIDLDQRRITVLCVVRRFLDMANARTTPTFNPVYTAEVGRKYIRIVQNGHGRHVHCFIDAETGDVLKAATWKAPAKDARGNLLTGFDEVEAVFDHHGGYLYKR